MAKKVRRETTATEAELIWEGDSRDVVRSFPEGVRKKLGEDIRRVQTGEKPKDFKPMSSIGSKVFELRQRDKAGWYRTIYLGVIQGRLHILHSFIKKSGKTPTNDLNVAKARLKEVRARIKEEKNRKK